MSVEAFLFFAGMRHNLTLFFFAGMRHNFTLFILQACVTTLLASFSGGFTAMVQSYFTCDKKQDVLTIVNGILGGLVGVTASCAVVDVFEALFIGKAGYDLI